MESLLQEMVIENSKLKQQLTEAGDANNNDNDQKTSTNDLNLLTEQITALNSKLQSSQKLLDDKSSALLALQTVNDELYKKHAENEIIINNLQSETKKLKQNSEKNEK